MLYPFKNVTAVPNAKLWMENKLREKFPPWKKMEASQNDFRWRSVQCSVGVAMAYAAVLTIKVRALF